MTLTQTAVLTKQVIAISTVAIILGLTSFIGYKVWLSYYLAHLPTVEEKPDTKFGLLPPPDFPKSNVSTSNFSYSVDTITGGLPKVGTDAGFEKILKVYFVVKSFASLLSADKSQILAEKFGISSPAEILSDTQYKFKDKTKTLNIDLDSGNFIYSNDATISAKEALDDDNKLILDFERILESLGILKEDLKNGQTRVTLLRAGEEGFIPTQLHSEADAARISLWPAQIDKKLIFTPDSDKALVNAVVFKGAGDIENYLSLNFFYYPIDTTTFATYPIKTAEQAFDDLRAGKGVVIVKPPKPEVSITSVNMGYFLGALYSPYLQPIFVFEGPSFVAYVSAIREEFQSTAK